MKTKPEELIQRTKSANEIPTVATVNQKMRDVLEQAKRYAPSPVCLLLRGETGVGKDFMARLIHKYSKRTGPFVDCTITDLPESLLESELFGYEKGAFTGATERRIGRLESAQGGTLFLNEVGKIPRYLQAKLFNLLGSHFAGSALAAVSERRPVGCSRSANPSCIADRSGSTRSRAFDPHPRPGTRCQKRLGRGS